MTPRDPIEEALRRPAPDEPGELPELHVGPGRLHRATPGRVRAGHHVRGARGPSGILSLVAVVALAAGAGLVALLRHPSHPVETPGATPWTPTWRPPATPADGFASFPIGALT